MLIDPSLLEDQLIQRLRAVVPDAVGIGTLANLEEKIARVRPDIGHQVGLGQEHGTPGIAVFNPHDSWGGPVCFLEDVPPFVNGVPSELDEALLEDFFDVLCWKLDQISDAVTEELKDAWPDRSFPKPYARIEHGSLLVWYGALERPALSLAPIRLESLRPTR